MDPASRAMRVSDHDRHAIAQRLHRAVGDGRLTLAEFEERTALAWAARTRGDLDDVTSDLPPDLW